MKKITLGFISSLLVLLLLVGCGASNTTDSKESPTIITVGATTAPHAEILVKAKELLAAKGYELNIVEYTDYIQPNLALNEGELDANYFQHQPYLTDFNAENNTPLVSVAAIHFEPLGLFPGQTTSIADLADGASIAVPNDTTNEARALLLLEQEGLITVNPEAGLKATIADITENPKNLEIIEIEAAQIARSLPDVDMAIINGNYAIQAGLNAATDALSSEAKDSVAATTFANIVVVKEGNENNEGIKALNEVLLSDEIRTFIEEKYQGAVVPVF